jgi:hypothetical protein
MVRLLVNGFIWAIFAHIGAWALGIDLTLTVTVFGAFMGFVSLMIEHFNGSR